MEVVVGALVGSITQIVIDKLSSIPNYQFGDSCEKLKGDFTRINAILHDAGMQQINSAVVKLWLKKLEKVAFEADNALDEFNYHLLRKEDWVSLPDQLQHLTALSSLHLRSFGMEELPEWLGNLSTLQELKLSCCSKLKHLPSVEAMQRLTNLKRLKIRWCPLLEETCRQQSDSDGDSV
ncbi:hypothetical protein ACS0TY_025896 [Phlomoides rotata]